MELEDRRKGDGGLCVGSWPMFELVSNDVGNVRAWHGERLSRMCCLATVHHGGRNVSEKRGSTYCVISAGLYCLRLAGIGWY